MIAHSDGLVPLAPLDRVGVDQEELAHHVLQGGHVFLPLLLLDGDELEQALDGALGQGRDGHRLAVVEHVDLQGRQDFQKTVPFNSILDQLFPTLVKQLLSRGLVLVDGAVLLAHDGGRRGRVVEVALRGRRGLAAVPSQLGILGAQP